MSVVILFMVQKISGKHKLTRRHVKIRWLHESNRRYKSPVFMGFLKTNAVFHQSEHSVTNRQMFKSVVSASCI